MKDSYRKARIISNENIAEGIYLMKVKGNFKGKPGEFYMIRGWKMGDPFLARPISINNIEDGSIDFLYERVGKGTDLMSRLKKNDELSLLGPLGTGFEISHGGRIALVSGGIGIAPLLYLAKELKGQVDLYSGFRDGVYYLDEFEPYVDKMSISTETGRVGHKGFVTELLNPEDYDLVITCGPTPMMKEVDRICRGKTELILSMESRMACGIGACMGCVIDTRSGKKRICKDGPVFNAREVRLNA